MSVTPLPAAIELWEKLGEGFNLNEYVYVALTEAGKKYLALHYAEFKESFERLNHTPPTDRSEFQLWELMQIFGPYMHLGMQVPFENNEIRFTENKYPLKSGVIVKGEK